MTTTDRAAFLREFCRNPFTVASVTPSGEPLANVITASVPATGTPLVVELGPGTGAFTAAIQRRLAGRGHHLAVEINERFARRLAARYPQVEVVVADARNLRELLWDRGYFQADAVVSGLPWTAFSPSRQDDLLGAVADILAPDGTFTTFAYTYTQWAPPARRLRRALGSRFGEAEPGRTVWANMPPAFVYSCRKPHATAERGTPAPVFATFS